MAIGDAIAAYLGTGVTDRQPSSGVEEILTSFNCGTATTDAVAQFNGSSSVHIFVGATTTGTGGGAAQSVQAHGAFLMITNSLYIRKLGTTDRWVLTGVQTAT